jgi:hypothetical protein
MNSLWNIFCFSALTVHDTSQIDMHRSSMANTALKVLKDLEVAGFRSAADLDILFHRSDPRETVKEHGLPEGNSRRKPDIVVTSLAAAQRVSDSDPVDLQWDELVERQVPNPPSEAFKSKYVLSWQEFKCPKPKLDPPPNSYGERPLVVPHKTNVREKVRPKHSSPIRCLPPRRQQGDQSSKRKREGSNPSIIFCRVNPTAINGVYWYATTHQPLSTRSTCQQFSVVHTDKESCNLSKRLTVSEWKAPPIIQCAMYGLKCLTPPCDRSAYRWFVT